MADKDRADEAGEEEDPTPEEPAVYAKYRFAADVANKSLRKVAGECTAGKKIVDLCDLGDRTIAELLQASYNKGKLEKGVAFPTCVSVNNIVGHYSPLADDTATLADGDVVKIDLGAQVDGFSAVVAQTIVVGSATNPVTGRKADVIAAAQTAADVALKLLKVGKKNTDITDAINKVAEGYKVHAVEGVLSHQIKRFVIDGNKVIINKETLDQKVEEIAFEPHEVYGVDIVMSTGEGKPKETESRTTIYKRALDQNYLLKLKAARFVYTEIASRFPTYPFTIRAFEDKRVRLGMNEIIKHDLVHSYPVLYEKPGEFVAQVKFTAIVKPSSTDRITGGDLTPVTSTETITSPDIRALLGLASLEKKKKKKNNKNKKKEGAKKEGEKNEGDASQKPAEGEKKEEQKAAPMDVASS
jgi:curved DNA binding protein